MSRINVSNKILELKKKKKGEITVNYRTLSFLSKIFPIFLAEAGIIGEEGYCGYKNLEEADHDRTKARWIRNIGRGKER